MTLLPPGYTTHLAELRKRLITSFISIVVCAGIAFLFAKQLTYLLMIPLFQSAPFVEKLIYTNLTEAFMSYLKVSLFAGVIVSAPVLLYEFWLFIAPALFQNEKKVFGRIILLSLSLFAGGALFAYFLVIPQLLQFFFGLGRDLLEPLPRLDAYLGFIGRTLLTFGLAFEIPFLIVATGKLGLVKKGYFKERRKYYYLALFIVSTLLSGGDLFSAILLTLPLLGLYEIGVLTLRLF